jgi:regulator of cell morphogenesis and NO signaling
MLEVALAAHARLEGELLFAELASRIGPAGPLQVMHMEHDAIDRTLAHLPTAADAAETWQLIREVMDIARVHFAKEEEILFPLADRTIPAEILQQLGRRWAELSGVRLP